MSFIKNLIINLKSMLGENKDGKLSEIEKSTQALVPVVNKITISDEAGQRVAIDLSNQIKARIKRVEELRLFFVGDLTKQVNKINAEFRAVKRPLEDMLEKIDGVLIDWRKKEMARIEKERQAEEERKRKEFEKEQEKLRKQAEKDAEAEKKRLAKLELSKKDEKAELKRIEEDKNAKIEEAKQDDFNFDDSDFQQSKTVHSETGSTTFKKVWDFEVVDPLEIPREFMQVDLVAIRKAVKDGKRVIPGVKIFETEVVNRKI
jgi:hypothetical protein